MRLLDKFKLGYWNIGVIEQSIDSFFAGNEYEFRWKKHQYTDRFFADPFLYKSDNMYYYILAE